MWSLTLTALVLAPLGIVYRRGERRAFWAGFVLGGWGYVVLSSGPWCLEHVRPNLVSTKLLDWAYPLLIPVGRQASNPRNVLRPFVLPPATLEEGLTIGQLQGARVDIYVKDHEKAPESLLVEGVQSTLSGNGTAQPTVLTDADGFERLAQAKAYSRKLSLRPHDPSPLAPLWSATPVLPQEFDEVGHPLFGLLCAWAGSLVSRYAFATRDPPP